MSRKLCLLGSLLLLLNMPSMAQELGEAYCTIIQHLPRPEGVSEMGFEVEPGACVYRWQFSQAPKEVITFYANVLPEQGWRIVRQEGSSLGIGEGYALEAVRDTLELHISAGQVFMMKVLEIRLSSRVAEEEEEAPVEGEEGEDLRKIMASLPVPEGAGRMAEEKAPGYLQVVYQYGGDLKKATAWIEEQLETQGWKITRKEMSSVGGLEGGTLEATRDGYALKITLASALVFKSITYTLQKDS